MAFTEKPPKAPEPNVAFVDPRTGRVTPAWYEFLSKLRAYLERLAASVP